MSSITYIAKQFQRHGMQFSGLKPDKSLVEILEIENHPWFVAVQFHPEFKSKPIQAHPLFAGFVGASIQRRRRDAKKEKGGFRPSQEEATESQH